MSELHAEMHPEESTEEITPEEILAVPTPAFKVKLSKSLSVQKPEELIQEIENNFQDTLGVRWITVID